MSGSVYVRPTDPSLAWLLIPRKLVLSQRRSDLACVAYVSALSYYSEEEDEQTDANTLPKSGFHDLLRYLL